MELQKMRHMIYPDEYRIVTHAVSSVMMEGDYTLCCMNILSSNFDYNGFEKVGKLYNGKLKEIDCKECIALINAIKKIK